MFLGRYDHSIDEKGRLTIPVKYRELLNEGAYVLQGFDRNLMVLTVSAFERLYERVSLLSLTDPVARQLKRFLLSSAERMEVDRVGRILLPQHLRDAAGLKGEARVVGVGDYFELWSPETWESQNLLLQDAEGNQNRFAVFDLFTR